MVLNRTIIKENFNQASNSYDAYASIQKQSAVYLISYLQKCFPNFCPKTILDLGTGTGYIPEVLLRIYPKSHMHLNDLSPRMIDLVKNKFQGHKQISYEVGDMENISLNPSELISTNFSIQWAADIFGLIKKCYASSNIFAFTCLLEHNFKEWYSPFISNFSEDLSPHHCGSEHQLILEIKK